MDFLMRFLILSEQVYLILYQYNKVVAILTYIEILYLLENFLLPLKNQNGFYVAWSLTLYSYFRLKKY